MPMNGGKGGGGKDDRCCLSSCRQKTPARPHMAMKERHNGDPSAHVSWSSLIFRNVTLNYFTQCIKYLLDLDIQPEINQ